MSISSDLLKTFLLLEFALLELLLSNDDALGISEVEGLGRNDLGWLLLKLLELIRRHEVCKVVFKDCDVRVDLALRLIVVTNANVNFGTKTLCGFLIKAFFLAFNLGESFLKPQAEFAEISLVLTVKLELLWLSSLPELFDCGPGLASTVRRLSEIFIRVVVLLALRTIESPVEVCLLIIDNVEDIKVIIFERVLSSPLKTDLSLTGHAECLNQLGGYELDLPYAALLTTSFDKLAIIASPGIVLRKVAIASITDNLSACALVLLYHNVI